MYHGKATLTIFVAYVLLKSNANECKTFKNARAEIYVTDDNFPIALKRGYYRQVSGCLNPTVLDSIIYFLSLKEEDIPILMKDSIKDFLLLDELYLTGNNINTLEEGALNNLPVLRILYLARNFIKEIPDNFFKNLRIEQLGLDGNQIDYISSTAFSGTSKLKWLYVNDNKISNFNREWFRDSIALEGIYLQNNKIRIVPRKAFYFNKKLINIELSNNNIDTIETNAFEGLSSLEFLNLTHNHLKQLSPDSFPIGIKINQLFLEANKLNYLKDDLIDKLILQELFLDGNPWKCACLKKLWNRLPSKSIKLPTSKHRICSIFAKCIAPKQNSRDCYDVYDYEATETFYDQQNSLKELTKEFMCLRFD